MIGSLALAGVIPVLLVRWENVEPHVPVKLDSKRAATLNP
jgi:hypothetical protein